MVDTGDSYEGICGYFHGTYISYTKEKPISMNPFAISEIEYNEDFKEKKNFLKSLIILIWKGSGKDMSKVETTLIDMVLEEYYDHYFNPFNHFSKNERDNIYDQLLLEYKSSGKYADMQINHIQNQRLLEKMDKLKAVVDRGEGGEQTNARIILEKLQEEYKESSP